MAGFSSGLLPSKPELVRRKRPYGRRAGAACFLGIDAMTNRAALHEDDWMMAVLSRHRRGQTEHVSRLGLPRDGFKAHGGKVMAFIDDDMPVVGDQIGDDALSDQALHERDIDVSGRLLLSAVDDAELVRRDIQEGLESRHPLVEKLPTMDQHQRVPSRAAIIFAAMTVLPNAVVAASTPVSCGRRAAVAFILFRRQLAEKPCPDRPS